MGQGLPVGNVTAVDEFPPTIADAVRASVECTFSSICGDKPILAASEKPDKPMPGVVGIISFTGTVPFSLCMIFPPPTLAAIAEKFIGFPMEFDSPDVGDMVGELVNVLAGEVSAQLDRRKLKAQMSLPTVTRGADVELLLPPGIPSARLGFQSTQGAYWVKLAGGKEGQLPGRKSGA